MCREPACQPQHGHHRPHAIDAQVAELRQLLRQLRLGQAQFGALGAHDRKKKMASGECLRPLKFLAEWTGKAQIRRLPRQTEE